MSDPAGSFSHEGPAKPSRPLRWLRQVGGVLVFSAAGVAAVIWLFANLPPIAALVLGLPVFALIGRLADLLFAICIAPLILVDAAYQVRKARR